MSEKVRFPFGEADELALTATGAQALVIDNDMTIIDGVVTEATGDRTLNLTIDEDVNVGARVAIQVKTSSTQNTIFGAGITGKTFAGVAGKTKTVEAVYNGTEFVVMGTPGQID